MPLKTRVCEEPLHSKLQLWQIFLWIINLVCFHLGDPDVSHSGTGSVLGVSANGAIPAQPPQVPPTYLSSAMSTSSGDSSSNATASNNSSHRGGSGGGHNLNVRRQSAGSHASASTHLRTFSSSGATSNQPKSKLLHQPFMFIRGFVTLLATLFALGAVFSSATIIFMKVF